MDWANNECIKIVSFLIVLNVKLFGHFSPKKVIRQGDPLSPNIFILVAEALSKMLNEAKEKGMIYGG